MATIRVEERLPSGEMAKYPVRWLPSGEMATFI
uniref:Uncharacterized protein n=1 Tax=Mesorhabditis belari TaxID=2138241 RepID=A0AAF3EHD5_9BILA